MAWNASQPNSERDGPNTTPAARLAFLAAQKIKPRRRGAGGAEFAWQILRGLGGVTCQAIPSSQRVGKSFLKSFRNQSPVVLFREKKSRFGGGAQIVVLKSEYPTCANSRQHGSCPFTETARRQAHVHRPCAAIDEQFDVNIQYRRSPEEARAALAEAGIILDAKPMRPVIAAAESHESISQESTPAAESPESPESE